MASYPDPEDRNELAADCRRCPDLVESRECISWGNGPLDATVVVVGEAPGAGAPDADQWRGGNWTGLAYTSRHSGRRVRDLLAEAGYGGDCYFTNAVKCFPADSEDSNREPTADERANCRPYLRAEIEEVEPAVVVPTGKHATRSVFALDGIELDSFLDAVLEPVSCPTLGTTALPLLHPSYQDVWIPQIGHTEQSYREAIGEQIDGLVGGHRQS
ncbi:uracil-DNA glycosylase [Halovenus sp. WSH3]|uniref:Uracil-DNA glycosylase n=1 Tax=Halovenus carboxidivorans TaxID=2692199 RepID=A0A6B0SYD7_9EURY|nr:uracil-DNA glycosylase [Halovenus carboxidivorans]MXR50375.1 uracil-DNA glycosylase [Halovenus carboxidivorans]